MCRPPFGPWADYVPWDEICASPAVRILKAIRFSEWLEFRDICWAMGVSPSQRRSETNLAADCIRSALRRLVRDGMVEQRKGRTIRSKHGQGAGMRLEFRISKSGIGALAELPRTYQKSLGEAIP